MDDSFWTIPPGGVLWNSPPEGTLWTIPPNEADVPGHIRRDTGWRLNPTTTPGSFMGCALAPGDTRQDLLRLGAPWTNPPDGPSAVVEHWGLQVLNAAGFVNGLVPADYTDQTFMPKGKLKNVGHHDQPLHPVLRRNIWRGLTDDDWDLIQPSLHLATAILDTPEMLRFFGAFFQPCRTEYSSNMQRNILLIEPSKALTGPQLRDLYVNVIKVRDHMSFRFRKQEEIDRYSPGAYGITRKVKGEGMIPGRTCRSMVTLTEAYLDALRLHRDPPIAETLLNLYQLEDNVEDSRKIHIDAAHSRLRIIFHLAECILHEFSHAVTFATIERERADLNLEPFFPTDRTPEVGNAMEKFMFGGNIDAHQNGANDCRVQSPYGLSLVSDPNWYKAEGLTGPPDSYPVYPVHSAWVSALFSKSFWEEVVGREGGQRIRCPLFYEWVAMQQIW